jgi:hypothetical protein
LEDQRNAVHKTTLNRGNCGEGQGNKSEILFGKHPAHIQPNDEVVYRRRITEGTHIFLCPTLSASGPGETGKGKILAGYSFKEVVGNDLETPNPSWQHDTLSKIEEFIEEN